MASEVGRELKAWELKARMVVVLSRPGASVFVTAWVKQITHNFVFFWQGVTRVMFAGQVREDGTVVDDTGQQVRVNEFLGAVDEQEGLEQKPN